MAEPFVGEIRLFPINYAPYGWLPCDGQLLQINSNTALFSLIGITFGGDGRTNFQLPDLRGRAALHPNPAANPPLPVDTSAGEAAHTLNTAEMPQHTHNANATAVTANQTQPPNQIWAKAQPLMYAPVAAGSTPAAMNPGTLTPTGGSTAHSNMQPYLSVQFCIATQGIYPQRP